MMINPIFNITKNYFLADGCFKILHGTSSSVQRLDSPQREKQNCAVPELTTIYCYESRIWGGINNKIMILLLNDMRHKLLNIIVI